MKILVIDNYDSFTYNLVQYIEELSGQRPDVVRNDKIELKAIEQYDVLVLSPGPGIPSEAGLLLDIIKAYAPSKPILGICLGHQAIAEVFGAELEQLQKVYHGIATTVIQHSDSPLFKELPKEFEAGRYHSWVVKPSSIPDSLKVTVLDQNDQIMALEHKEHPVYGVQFHPESVLTPLGKQLIQNFLIIANSKTTQRYENATPSTI
ncbi:MAG: aminodeoxychorismate/anthranilate synthase component II [Aureispira sp.]|nr:aminodeoxychorismate/anthranilate synthase component II [Aureispira sp.]